MALNFLSHLIKIANNILGIMDLFPPTTTTNTVICFGLIPIFAIDSSVQFYFMSPVWCHLSFLQQLFQLFWPNQIYSVLQNSILQSFLLHWLLFAAYPHLSSCPFHLYIPFPVLHVSLLSSTGLFVLLLSLDFKISPSQELFFYSSCSVLYTLDTQYMFDDWELTVCRYPTIFNRVS